MFWSPDLDDFTGNVCNEGKYPLMNHAVNLVRDQVEMITTTKPSTTSTRRLPPRPSMEERKRSVCYYTKYIHIWFLLRKKSGIGLFLVGHSIVLMVENLSQKISIHLYVRILSMPLQY